MRSNKKNVNELTAGDQRFQKGSAALKNRLQWRIRSAAKALKANVKLESRPAEVRRPIYAIGRDCVAPPVAIGLQGKNSDERFDNGEEVHREDEYERPGEF